jgi:hypothetical protein
MQACVLYYALTQVPLIGTLLVNTYVLWNCGSRLRFAFLAG